MLRRRPSWPRCEQLDSSLEQSIEAYNFANVELDRIDQDLVSNGKHLVAARKSLVVAQGRIAERLRDLYINGEGDSTLEVILGSRSLDDIIARLDAIERISSQDAGILRTVKKYRKEVETRRARLLEARADQARLVSERAAQKASIEGRSLPSRQQLLGSIKDEIVQLQAEERQRQAALAAQARARVQALEVAAQVQQDTAQATYDTAVVEPAYDPNLPAARYGHVVGIALQYLGIPYVWGGSSPSTGFDCSGFTVCLCASRGVASPPRRFSVRLRDSGFVRSARAPATSSSSAAGHAGIYIGGGQFVHAPHTGDVVRISSMYDSWYSSGFEGGRRL